jgi:nitrite reductase/ring-hydroxylating ferredoxin subunit
VIPGLRPPVQGDGFVPLVRADRLRDGLRTVRTVRGLRLLLLHEGGESFVVEDRCPHMGARLARGHVDEGTLWCPKHGFRYDLASGARVAPASALGACEALRCFPVEVRDGWVGARIGD